MASGVHPSDRVGAATIWGLWQAAVETWPQRDFLCVPAQATREYSDGAIELSYAEAHREAVELGARYATAGYGHGQRVALALDNRAEALLHVLALNSLGVAVVPLNMELTANELGYILGNVDCCLVVALGVHVPAIRAALAVAGLDCPCQDSGTATAFPPCARVPEPGQPGPATIAAIVYTSGTTGQPKGCLLSNLYCLTVGEWYAGLGGLLALREGGERLLTPLPLFHINALVFTFVTVVRTGNCLVQLDRFHASSWWESVRESRATAFHYLGVMPAILLQRESVADEHCAGRVRFGFGAGVDPRHHEAFEARFGVPLVEGWAMTETGAAACMMVHEEPRHVGMRHVGRPPAYLEVRLVDENGDAVPAGGSGEMLVRARGADPRKGFFSGYFGNAAATQEAWDGDWLHTGDVLRHDAQGSLYFVERRKNMIRRSGENIAAAEVESALAECPQVRQCAVAAVPDSLRGEEVLALVILDAGHAPDDVAARALFEQCRARLSYHKLPAYIGFVDALPVTGTQKVQRRELRELGMALLEAGRCTDLRASKRRN